MYYNQMKYISITFNTFMNIPLKNKYTLFTFICETEINKPLNLKYSDDEISFTTLFGLKVVAIVAKNTRFSVPETAIHFTSFEPISERATSKPFHEPNVKSVMHGLIGSFWRQSYHIT